MVGKAEDLDPCYIYFQTYLEPDSVASEVALKIDVNAATSRTGLGRVRGRVAFDVNGLPTSNPFEVPFHVLAICA